MVSQRNKHTKKNNIKDKNKHKNHVSLEPPHALVCPYLLDEKHKPRIYFEVGSDRGANVCL
jgi:hypothetical protein